MVVPGLWMHGGRELPAVGAHGWERLWGLQLETGQLEQLGCPSLTWRVCDGTLLKQKQGGS